MNINTPSYLLVSETPCGLYFAEEIKLLFLVLCFYSQI